MALIVRGIMLDGTGEHSRVVVAALDAGAEAIYFFDGQPRGYHAIHVAFAGKPGTPNRRNRIAELGEDTFATIIHPAAVVPKKSSIGSGVFIAPMAYVSPCATQIWDHAIINTGAIIEHDCNIGRGVHVAPRAVIGGGVTIEAWATIGMGAVIRDHVRIGEGAVIGMGSVVTKDVPRGAKVMGVPAR